MAELPDAGIDRHLEEARRRISMIEPAVAAALRDEGAVLVDTRPIAQRDAHGTIAGAIVIDRNVLEWRIDPTSPHRDARIDPDRPLIVFCQQGYSSSLAVAALVDIGVGGVHDLRGGFDAWRAAGLPIEGGRPRTGPRWPSWVFDVASSYIAIYRERMRALRREHMRHEGGRFRKPGEGFGHQGRPRMRRGDIRTAVLAILDEQPRHGYEVIQALEDKTGGAWRPSAGSIYPTLQLLEDEGLARSSEREGKRVYELTDAGRAEAHARIEEAGGPPWSGAEGGGSLRGALMQLHIAARQVGAAGNKDQNERAVQIVTDARKQLYRLLAED